MIKETRDVFHPIIKRACERCGKNLEKRLALRRSELCMMCLLQVKIYDDFIKTLEKRK